ncbi:MAG: C-GCAxxG-C-C family protein [Candidatus Kariarchaeaceae archaeon]|jgi:C_GCAxxG_C_C family probable redox protein
MNDLIELTLDYWKKEDCARSTACGLLEYYDQMSAKEVLYKAILPFAEGTGERSICGSISGSLAAMSYILSEKGLSKVEIRKKISSFKDKFKQEFNTLMCSDLLDNHLGDRPYPPDPERLEICTKSVTTSVSIAQKLLDDL